MKIDHIKHVFFDLDHTLWDFDRNSALTFEKIFALHQLPIFLEDFLKIYEPVNLIYWQRYRNEQIDENVMRHGRLKETFDQLKFPISTGQIELLATDYLAHLASFTHLFEGTLEILDYLKSRYKLHIITNGAYEAQCRKMQTSGIMPFFDTITHADTVGVKKPNPRIFEAALSCAQAQAHQSVMVGDSFEADIQGAVKVGYQAIFFNHRKDVPLFEVNQIERLEQIKIFL